MFVCLGDPAISLHSSGSENIDDSNEISVESILKVRVI